MLFAPHYFFLYILLKALKQDIRCNLLEFIDSELISKIESVCLGKLGNNGNRLKIRMTMEKKSKHIDVGKPTLTKIFSKIYTNHLAKLEIFIQNYTT